MIRSNFSIIRLGAQAYFEGKTRDSVSEVDFIIEKMENSDHFIVTSKKTNSKHFIPIYNISYAEIKTLVQNDSVKESVNEDSAGDRRNSRENELSNGTGAEKKGKKSKKD